MRSETKIPGKKAKHAIITNKCRAMKGSQEAFDEAVGRMQGEYNAVLVGREGTNFNVHLVLVVEPLE